MVTPEEREEIMEQAYVLDRYNVEMFSLFGVSSSDTKRYVCTRCNKPVSIDESISFRGLHLFCSNCEEIMKEKYIRIGTLYTPFGNHFNKT